MSELSDLWDAIVAAGGIDRYVEAQLETHGFVVARRETDGMSKREKDAYKRSLKREAAERRALRKAAWAAYRASHIVHLGDGIHFCDADTDDRWDLPEPDARLAENELPRLDGPQDLADALGLTVPEVRWLAYHRDVAKTLHYVRFTIPKRSGGERAIWAPMPKLKAAQRWILQNIVEPLPVHGAAHGFLPGRSILTNARPHVGSRLIVNVDLQDFFPTVTWRRVRGVFRKAGYREQVATLLALICTEAPREVVPYRGETRFVALGPRCLPQGAPTSPALTNTLCLRLDRRLSGHARKLGYTYTRYADDLTFSLPATVKGNPRTGQLLGGVKAIVAAEGFRVNADKTAVRRTGGRQQVTGLVVNGTGVPRVPRPVKRQLRAALHNLAQGRPLPEGESLARLAGWAAFVQMSEPELGRAMLEQLGQHV
jgi:hypothetical protein